MKYFGYLEVARRKTYQKHFDFPNMIVPVVTTSKKRMLNMMKLLNETTNGKGCSFIIFKYVPHFTSMEKTPEPTDILLTRDWERV